MTVHDTKGSIVPKTKSQSATVVDLDSEESIGEVGVAGKVVPAQSNRRTGVTRKDPSEHPACPHCGGKMHWNQAAATINFECLWRQYCLSQGTITDPNDRLPIFTDDELIGMLEWVTTRKRSRKNPLRYGKMEAPGGGFGTYAALKAATAKDIKELAEEEDVVSPKKKRKKAEAPVLVVQDKSSKNKPGRPKKSAAPVIEEVVTKSTKNKPGRPKKNTPTLQEIVATKPKKVGRPKKHIEPEFEFDLDIIEDEAPPTRKTKKKKVVSTPVVNTKSGGKTKKKKRAA